MVTEAPTLFPRQHEAVTPPSRGEHSYFRRVRDGKIVTAGAWPSHVADMEYRGFRRLSEYGTFTIDSAEGEPNRDINGIPFNATREPWRLILQQGGAKEFPVWQVIALHWHVRPPYREVSFPQLEGIKVYDLMCPECENVIFSSDDETEAIDHLRTHLTSRINQQHSYRPEDFRALGEEYGIDFFAPRRSRRPVREAPIVESAITLTPSEDFVCNECGQVCKNALGLGSHKRSHSAGAKALV